jgi:hypothetical protein
MTNYCNNQWMIVKYPGGSGGKFVTTCLFLFNKVAHWHGITDQQATVDYFKNSMLDTKESWINREINHRWNLNFFSRSQNRNNNLTEEEFNKLTNDNGSEYFKECWKGGLDIVDYWSKPNLPKFWENAKSFSLVIDDNEIYKNLVVSKLFKIDYKRNVIISLLDDHRNIKRNEHRKHAESFNNQFEFPLIDIDDFFESVVKKKSWAVGWNNFTPDSNEFTIKISELVNHDTFIQKFQWFEDYYKQKIPVKYITELHSTWSKANEQQQQKFNNHG